MMCEIKAGEGAEAIGIRPIAKKVKKRAKMA